MRDCFEMKSFNFRQGPVNIFKVWRPIPVMKQNCSFSCYIFLKVVCQRVSISGKYHDFINFEILFKIAIQKQKKIKCFILFTNNLKFVHATHIMQAL